MNGVGLAKYLAHAFGFRQKAPKVVFYLNTHTIRLVCEDEKLGKSYRVADAVYCDGWGAVWLARLAGVRIKERATTMDFFHVFCETAQNNKLKIFLLGGNNGVADRAMRRLGMLYPGLKIVGCSDGYFNNTEEIIKKINQSKPDVLLVGMGTPRQEKWLVENKNKLKIQLGWAVGSLFEYLAEDKPRSPVWLGKLHLEWLFRMIVEPNPGRRYLADGLWLLKELSFGFFLKPFFQIENPDGKK